MSSVAHSFVTWADFLQLPERAETGQRYELHDGEVILVPPAKPLHVKLQKRIEQLLESLAGERCVVTIEFPYRPVVNLQYWVADVACILRADWDALPPDEYPVYAPALVVEVLSPSNTPVKINRQRVVAMSAGAQEFWVVDPEKRTVHVTDLRGAALYAAGDVIPAALFGTGGVAVDHIFAL
jgi:Uma2 family endonuclease